MKTRVRKGGRCEDRVIGNMAWAEYVHLTARPVKGVIDPQLHVHCVVLNVVHDPVEDRWKAGQFRDIKRDAPRFQVMFRSLFAQRLAGLGFPVEWKGEDFEIAGIGRATIEKFSGRSNQINRVAADRGITSPRVKGQLGAETREPKRHATTLPELRKEWRARLTDHEAALLDQAVPRRQQPLVAWEQERRDFIRQRQRRVMAEEEIIAARGRR
jgi:conjugative relaxase-like TrwC/TraI family protein